MKDVELYYMNGHKYLGSKFDKAILPVGSLERHGDHLPVGSDTMIAYNLSKLVAEEVKNLMVLPPITYGVSGHLASFDPTLSLEAETLVKIIEDILKSLVKRKLYKIIIFNGHDGNIGSIDIASYKVKEMYPEMKIAVVKPWWILARKLLPPGTFEVWNGEGHAGEAETSLISALHPESVDMKYAKGSVPVDLWELPEDADIEMKWLYNELTPNCATGDPTKASKEKGEKMKKALVKLIVDFIKRMDAINWKYDLLRKS